MKLARLMFCSALLSGCLAPVGCVSAPADEGTGGTGSGGNTTSGSGGGTLTGSGGKTATGSGGTTPTGSGGISPTGSGGTTPAGSGGTSPTGSGGKTATGSGGTTPIASGGITPIASGGRVATGSGGATGGRAGGGAGGRATTGSGGMTASGGSGVGGATNACAPGPALTGGTVHSANGQGNASNGYTWNLYKSGSGAASVTTYSTGAAFTATWNNSGDFLGRVGLGFNSTKTPTQLGTLSADFAENKTGTAGGYSYIGIYGWSENPLKEFYIVEDWFGSRPLNGTKVGTITVDGGTYDVLQHMQTGQPSITGSNADFNQYFSVRQTARQCGHISISQHFSQWASMGLPLGNMEEARILVEAGGGSGTVNFTTGAVTLQ